jgi:hypothetical protein
LREAAHSVAVDQGDRRNCSPVKSTYNAFKKMGFYIRPVAAAKNPEHREESGTSRRILKMSRGDVKVKPATMQFAFSPFRALGGVPYIVEEICTTL